MPIDIGEYHVDRPQPPLSPADEEVVRRFHDLNYRRWQAGADTLNLSWFGYEVVKCPLDLWVYQELLVCTRPDVVVETGTWCGGSALFIAMILDQIGHGTVITVDVTAKPNRPQHPRIKYLSGASTEPRIVQEVTDFVGGGRAMVVLDSNHYTNYVYDELQAYSPLVKVGDYLIVEDTNADAIPTAPEYRDGPMQAITKFLSENNDFFIEDRCERFLLTLNPRGYLRRKQL